MKRLLFVCVFLACASTVHAQPITKWTLRVYNVGAPTPLSAPTDILVANVTCNTTLTITPGVNPVKAAFDDPVNVGKVCVWTDPGNGPLLSTPFGGSYEATLTATNSAGTGPETTRAPFTHPGVAPPAPTGLQLGK